MAIDDLGFIMMEQKSVKISALVLNFLGIGTISASFIIFGLIVYQSLVNGSIGYFSRRLLRGFLMRLIQGIIYLVTNWTLLEKQKVAIKQHTQDNILVYIKRSRWIRIGIIIFNFGSYFTNYVINIRNFANEIERNQPLFFLILLKIIIVSVLPLCFFAHIYMFYLLDHVVTLLIADFMHFNSQLKRLKCLEQESLEDLLSIRELFSLMVRNTQNFENFIRYEVGRLYIGLLTIYIMNIYEIVLNDGKADPQIFLLLFINCSTAMAFTYKAIRLNAICHQESETLYELSLHIRSHAYQEEIILFYERFTRRDVGFTFFGIFTLTSNFVVSLVTVAVSILMAVPGYIPLIRKRQNA